MWVMQGWGDVGIRTCVCACVCVFVCVCLCVCGRGVFEFVCVCGRGVFDPAMYTIWTQARAKQRKVAEHHDFAARRATASTDEVGM